METVRELQAPVRESRARVRESPTRVRELARVREMARIREMARVRELARVRLSRVARTLADCSPKAQELRLLRLPGVRLHTRGQGDAAG
ncbi:hypothetical protein T492DRAFT_224059 [Pavlovales sp. CCMP2436]|nr:hypothetical protein T492DRAFT_224059 [Pavlovales sp. CCMP2436]